MAKKRKTGIIVLPFVLSMALYVVFNDNISSKPDEAGFWIILVMGMSIGLILRHLFKK